ncbi:MAG: cellulase family glycosylhydrolase [Deltaproteobacteria bacterium]|nr:cellulase family glycosylhydrolase [Deltaproteobacteria bacterium]
MKTLPRFTCDGRWIRDELGRVRLFRGANVSGRSKLPPFLPFDAPAAFDPLARWGWNVVRLLVIWEALEPERGTYDDAYLAKIQALAKAAGERGLHVIIDFHQDLFSRALGGDGAPGWALPTQRPSSPGRSWFFRYLTRPSVGRAFERFWRDADGLRSSMLACMRRVMRAMTGSSAVLGYDVFNEPMGDLAAFLGGDLERRALPAYYEACVRARDELDPTRLLFIEPSPFAAFGAPVRLPRLAARNVVFAPHLYDAPAILAGRYLRAASLFPLSLRRLEGTARRLDMPLLVGEFGVLNGAKGGGRMIEDACCLLDRAFASWAVWHYNPTDVDWNEEDASIVTPDGGDRPWTGALVRPYPRALAGEPVGWESGDGGPWRLRYRAAGDATTEIVIPQRWAGGRARVRVEGAASRWTLEDEGALLSIEAPRREMVVVELER